MKKILFLMLIFSMIFCSFAYAKVSVPETIRIGIYSSGSSVSSFTISSKSGMQVGTVDANGAFTKLKDIEAGKTITIKKGASTNRVNVEGIGDVGDGTHFLKIYAKDMGSTPLLKVNSNQYRGSIEVRRYSSSDMTVMNELAMQEYLYGVVPREIGGSSPIEAVKAQAIIARTYAAKNYQKRANLGFDLTNTVSDQAYGGYDWEYPNSNKAVDETNGMVAVYQGELIGGYYFSTSGGYTESSVNVWGGEVDYLEAVPDPYEPTNLEKTTWTVTYSNSDIEKKLAEKGVNIGSVKDMVVTEVSDAGRALTLEVRGTNGTQTYTKSNIRTFLGLNSQWFTINDEAPQIPNSESISNDENQEEEEDSIPEKNQDVDDLEIISVKHFTSEETDDVIIDVEEGDKIIIDTVETNENNEMVEEEIALEDETKPLMAKLIDSIRGIKTEGNTILAKLVETKEPIQNDVITKNIAYASRGTTSATTFKIQGRGWGHSVGMSQNGAIGMAKNQFSAEEIVKCYYRGVEIVKK